MARDGGDGGDAARGLGDERRAARLREQARQAAAGAVLVVDHHDAQRLGPVSAAQRLGRGDAQRLGHEALRGNVSAATVSSPDGAVATASTARPA